jgi:lysophospholipase L1-like esterase
VLFSPQPLGAQSSYIGGVATRCYIGNSFNTGPRNVRLTHYASVDIDGEIVVGMVNAVAGGAGEVLGSAPVVVTASFNPQIGQYRQMTWRGQASVTIQPGAVAWCDPLLVSVRKRNPFWITQFWNTASGVPIVGTIGNSNIGDAGEITSTDKTMSGTIGTFQATGFSVMPTIILGRTREPTLVVLGDSRTVGGQQSATQLNSVYGDAGELAMPLAPNFSVLNLGASGETAQGFLTASTTRQQFLKYATHVINEYGVNDLAAGRTAAQLEADQLSIRKLCGPGPYYLCTIPPQTNSTGNWTAADGSDQTLFSDNAQRVLYCDWVRARQPWFAPIELADYTELPPRNSGKWRAPGITVDGTHESTLGNQQYAIAKELFAPGGVGHMPQVFPV